MKGPDDALTASRLLPRDVFAVGSSGLRSRRLRAALSALGVAIGIASMVAVLGISASSQADLLRTIDRLGTNLLSVQAGESFFGDASKVPQTAEGKLASIPGVQNAAATYTVRGRRSVATRWSTRRTLRASVSRQPIGTCRRRSAQRWPPDGS